MPFTAHSIFPLPYLPACLSPARRAFPSASLRLSGRSPRLPSVTPERFSFSGYLSLPRRTSAIRFAARPPRIGHTRPTLSRYHISVPVRSDRYVISVQCLRCPACRAFHVSRVYLDLSSCLGIPLLLFDAEEIRFSRALLPHSFLHRNLHLSSLTYLVLLCSAFEIHSTLISFLLCLHCSRSPSGTPLPLSLLESFFLSTFLDTPPHSLPPFWPRLF